MVGVLSVAVVVGVLTMRPTVILLPEEDLLRVRCAAYSLALSGGASAVAVVGSAVNEAIGSKTEDFSEARGFGIGGFVASNRDKQGVNRNRTTALR